MDRRPPAEMPDAQALDQVEVLAPPGVMPVRFHLILAQEAPGPVRDDGIAPLDARRE